jgi:hypothetical protein
MDREFFYSDLHKDVYGCRPGAEGMRWFNALPYEDKCREYDRLCKQLEEQMEIESVQELHAEADFENTIYDLVKSGARDRETALRWYVDSLNLKESDLWYGGSYVTYLAHLPYHMSAMFDPIVKQMEREMRDAA